MADIYTIVFDSGIPSQLEAKGLDDLKRKLLDIYHSYKTENPPSLDIIILNEKGEDITESQLIDELAADIINEVV